MRSRRLERGEWVLGQPSGGYWGRRGMSHAVARYIKLAPGVGGGEGDFARRCLAVWWWCGMDGGRVRGREGCERLACGAPAGEVVW